MTSRSPCLDPTKTAYEKMIEAIEFSEINRTDGDNILRLWRPQVTRDLIQRHKEAGRRAPTLKEIEVATELLASNKPEFKTSVANERWGWRLALMYSAQVQRNHELRTQHLLETLIDEVRVLRSALELRSQT